MNDLYIYYRVRSENAALLYPLVRSMLERLGTGQLKRKHGEQDGMQTWMEVYSSMDAGFPARLAAAEAEAGIAPYIEGARHVEEFTDICF